MSPENSANRHFVFVRADVAETNNTEREQRSNFFFVGKVLKKMNKNLVARTYLYTCWSYFGVAFFGRKGLTDFKAFEIRASIGNLFFLKNVSSFEIPRQIFPTLSKIASELSD